MQKDKLEATLIKDGNNVVYIHSCDSNEVEVYAFESKKGADNFAKMMLRGKVRYYIYQHYQPPEVSNVSTLYLI